MLTPLRDQANLSRILFKATFANIRQVYRSGKMIKDGIEEDIEQSLDPNITLLALEAPRRKRSYCHT
jgi:hypothetical protein